MDGRGRRSYKMFQTQFLPPSSFLLLPPPDRTATCTSHFFIFLFFTKPWYFIISSSLYPSRAMKASHLPLSSPLLSFFFFFPPLLLLLLPLPSPAVNTSSTVTVQFWVRGASKKMSQLIRKPDTLKRLQCFNYSKGVNYWPLNGFLFLTLRYSYRNVSNTASRPEYKLTNVRNVLFFFLLKTFNRISKWDGMIAFTWF